MARRTRLNESGYQVGSSVRVERGLQNHPLGHIAPGAEVVWIVSKKVDVSGDEKTTYSYRYDEVKRFAETEFGECPKAALELADKIAEG
jgi:hypothetical protein